MSYYTPLIGTVTNIEAFPAESERSGCSLLIELMTQEQEMVSVVLSSLTYVLNSQLIQPGDRMTFFYDPQAPTVLIYPPRYTAVAAAHTPYDQTAILDFFDSDLTNSDQNLTLNRSVHTPVTLPNGQFFLGNPAQKLLLVIYSSSSKSIPAQTTPDQIVVFCSEEN